MKIFALLIAAMACGLTMTRHANADSPVCVSPETKMSWPNAVNPIWEMCWIPPRQTNGSVGPRGSGLELRNVYYRGQKVLTRAHAPMLFAEYKDGSGGNCYRDWKDVPTATLAAATVQNQLGNVPAGGQSAITSCDRSANPVLSYGTCPFGLTTPANYTCATGVAIENLGNRVRMTAQYVADWYMYSSRFVFFADGRFEPSFGFGNRNGTFNSVTHWHHNYWRLEFDVEATGANRVSTNGVDDAVEFSQVRSATGAPNGGARTWEVRNPVTGNGYRLVPGRSDYDVPANESGRNFHTIDFMATKANVGEYGDTPNYSLSDCTMHKENLVNNQSILDTTTAIYYRVAVRDTTANSWPPGCSGAACQAQDSMVCKTMGPMFVPFGNWADYTFNFGFEYLLPGNGDYGY